MEKIHRHVKMEKELGVDDRHVIIDKEIYVVFMEE